MKQKQNDCKSTGLALLSKYILQVIGHFNMKPHHFVQVFVNIYLSLLFLFLESLNDLHINTVSLQQGYSKTTARILLSTLKILESMKLFCFV